MDDLTLEHPDLQELLDGGAERLPERVLDHLARCESCASEMSALRELRSRARGLPREMEPPRNLWPEIADRITGVPTMAPALSAAVRSERRVARDTRQWGWLAAAAMILMVITAGATAYLLRGGGAAGAPTASAVGTPAVENGIGLAAFAAADTEYRYTVETLEAELAARRGSLNPATIAAVEENLAIIDNAIAEARQALAADPTSADLPLLLAGVYRRKVELLRQAVDLSARS